MIIDGGRGGAVDGAGGLTSCSTGERHMVEEERFMGGL
jgi:hypothetical protein